MEMLFTSLGSDNGLKSSSECNFVTEVLILYIRSGIYSLKSAPHDRLFFEELFMAIFIY